MPVVVGRAGHGGAATAVAGVFLLVLRRAPSSTLFPYTTLFRSEGEGGRAARAALGLAHVIDRQRGSRIVVHDRARAGVLRDGRAGGTAQLDREGLAQLEGRVRADLDRDGLARVAWREGQRAGLADVVGRARGGGGATAVAGGGPVDRREADRDRLGGGPGLAHREGEDRRAARAALGLAHVIDRQRGSRIVVHDRARAGVLRDGRAGGTAQLDREGLAQLEGRVRADLDRDGLARVTRREGQRAGLADVVGRARAGGGATAVAGGGPVYRRKADRDRLGGVPGLALFRAEGGRAARAAL